MKVEICPICRITPEISIKEVKCPKCGRSSVGEDFTDTINKWNNRDYSAAGTMPKVVIKDEETLKAEAIAEIEELEKKEEKEEKKPVKRVIKKKGDK